VDHHEFYGLTLFLQNLYGEQFPELLEGMARVWYDTLKRYDGADAEAAVYQWATQHTRLSPSLDQLCEAIEFLVEERRRSRRSGREVQDLAAVLREAAEAQARNPERTESEARFGHLMALIGERSVAPWVDAQGVRHEKLTLEQRATQCYEWANQYQASDPKLAEDLRYVARVYARVYHEEEETA